ncbi:thiolase [Aromatoleum petrolei]|uniref:Thiolase n=1 Tax=Aromatoleum petrolei TaxID=76116 RepID=A0ABX1MKR4_9RHOO|nr:thiolase [Aromatoleum petrolei]NMF88562.1 thiolase [Aromatoleum petrolei]QTQ34730.1 Thiolase [Aromatoleum petrolei]
MKDSFPRGRTAIVGAATFGMGEAPGFTNMELAARASVSALAQAGLTPKDVDGLFIVTMDDTMSGLSFAEYLGIRPRLTDNCRTGGSSFEIQASLAALALDAGQCDVVLIAYGSNQRTAAGKLISSNRPSPWESPYRPINPVSSYALAAARHMHQYGTTKQQLGEVAVAARKWAQKNPDAFMRDELTMEAYMAARQVSSPLGVRDCCLVTDGAAAVVMSRADRARDLNKRPAYLLGAAAETTHREIAQMADLTVTGVARAAQRAFAQAGVRPADIDVVELYDAFTINTILFLEDMGFCPKGEGGHFVSGGRIAPGGELPVNTNGGGLSCVHPGMYGLFTMVEAVQQLQGVCGERQVQGARLAVAQGNGGVLSSEAVLVLGTEETL